MGLVVQAKGRGGTIDDPRLVVLSVDVHRLLMAAYPSKFRSEYGPLMSQVYRDECLTTHREGGLAGMLGLWARTIIDLVMTVVGEHMQKEAHMTKSNFIRWSGWALIGSGILFPLAFLASMLDTVTSNQIEPGVLGIIFGAALLGIGMLGLRSRYGKRTGPVGSGLLLVGAIAGIVGSVAMVVNWWVFVGSVMLTFACLALFGGVTLKTRPFARWNGLPLLAVIPFLSLIELVPEMLSFVFFIIFGVGLALLGYMLQATPQEQTAYTG